MLPCSFPFEIEQMKDAKVGGDQIAGPDRQDRSDLPVIDISLHVLLAKHPLSH